MHPYGYRLVSKCVITIKLYQTTELKLLMNQYTAHSIVTVLSERYCGRRWKNTIRDTELKEAIIHSYFSITINPKSGGLRAGSCIHLKRDKITIPSAFYLTQKVPSGIPYKL